MNPIGLYIHIPYCLHKCGYCDFNSHNLNEEEMKRYVDAVVLEMEHYSRSRQATDEVTSLFFGGGTPTTLPFPDLVRLLEASREFFQIAPQAEITVEANPATIPQTDLSLLVNAGFNRISIGVQSFDPKELEFLARVHNVDEVDLTVHRAREAGFDNLSLDLMYGLPGQSLEQWNASLQKALNHEPEHISAYNLTIEPNTRFHKLFHQGAWRLPDEDHQLTLYRHTIKTLTEAGYRHYEISNYARDGRECRHNLLYWDNGDYLGLGAGAASYLKGERRKNQLLPSRYIREVEEKGSAVDSREQLEPRHAMGETVMLGLRQMQGLDLDRFEQRFQVSWSDLFGETVDRLQEQNLVSLKDRKLTLSERGLALADSVILEFLA
jgi:oxygen-independent coproporphyrinogen-3 oxidase